MSIHNLLVPNNLDIFAKSITVDTLEVETLSVENLDVTGTLTANDIQAVTGDFSTSLSTLLLTSADIVTNNLVVNNNTSTVTLDSQSITATGNISCATLTTSGIATFGGSVGVTGSVTASSGVVASAFNLSNQSLPVSNTSIISNMLYRSELLDITVNATGSVLASVAGTIQKFNNMVTIYVSQFLVTPSPGAPFYLTIEIPALASLEPTSHGTAVIDMQTAVGTYSASLARTITSLGVSYISIRPDMNPTSLFADGSPCGPIQGFTITYLATGL